MSDAEEEQYEPTSFARPGEDEDREEQEGRGGSRHHEACPCPPLV